MRYFTSVDKKKQWKTECALRRVQEVISIADKEFSDSKE